MTVLMFHKRFVPLIKQGLKRQTIRPPRKRPIKVGDALSLRFWEGQGYRSPMVTILDVTCVALFSIRIDAGGIEFGEGIGPISRGYMLDDFARDDGFTSWADMLAWYHSDGYGLPFSGNLIQWGQQ